MLLPLLLLAADPETAIDAERAFNRAAQTEGQWTAFRKFSTPDAVMFVPRVVKAHDWLPLKNPPIAVQWWPAESFVSCDGNVAVNTGPWVRPNGFGYFTTIWVRQPDGRFKWIYDAGDTLETPRPLPEEPKVTRASCDPLRAFDNTLVAVSEGGKTDTGFSPDGTLRWDWVQNPDGERILWVEISNGERTELVLRDRVGPSK